VKKDLTFVGIQGLLFLAYAFNPDFLKINVPKALAPMGVILAGLSVPILFWSLFELDRNLSPFPSPKVNGELITRGMYKFIRHPIYTGILMFAYGLAFYWSSSWKLLIASALFVLFRLKSEYEEKLLEDKFPKYREYKTTTGRFLPKL
jgi:protein-S-isoprenylcysteine O-methyltransferase Ste14